MYLHEPPSDICSLLKDLVLWVGNNRNVDRIHNANEGCFGHAILRELTAVSTKERLAISMSDLWETKGLEGVV